MLAATRPEPVMKRDEYLAMRRQYEPEHLRLVIVAESPPTSGKYFYNPTGLPSEPLFSALMRQLCFSASTKERGLREFQRRGWLLVDATYEPVNNLSDPAADAVIARDYPQLRNDLGNLLGGRSIPLILVKANVCRALDARLRGDGFSVLNGGRLIYFPAHGLARKFYQQFGEVLKSAHID